MYIKKLKLSNFRNYENLDINFAENFNVLYGFNGQGKTNILEAIYLCASGRSHRTAKDIDLLKLDQQNYFIKMQLVKDNVDSSIEISFDKNEKRKIKINEIPIKKIGNLMGHLNAVIFSPEDLLIIKEGPAERRRFIDITISQLKPSYFYDLQQYNKVLIQRNNLLKELQYKKYLMDTLEVWNNNLTTIGSRIMKVRYEFLKRLDAYAQKNHGKLTNDLEKLKIVYSPSVEVEEYKDLQTIEGVFKKTLESAINKELVKTSTLFGPQRDDFDILINDMNIKLYGSQGQQRTAILSIKLSEIDLMKEETGEFPVLLLDDVMSELDNKRQDYLVGNLEDIQTFITCTDKDFFIGKLGSGSNFYKISAGSINIF